MRRSPESKKDIRQKKTAGKRLYGRFCALFLSGALCVCGCGSKSAETDPSASKEEAVIEAEEHAPSAEDLLDAVETKLETADSISGMMQAALSMDYTIDGVTSTLEVTTDETFDFLKSQGLTHLKGTFSINLTGLTYDTESYIQRSGQKSSVYAKSFGTWYLEEQDGEAGIMDLSGIAGALRDSGGVSLSVTEDADYLLSGSAPAGTLSAMIYETDDLLKESGASFDELTASVSLTSDKDGNVKTITFDFTESYQERMQAHLETAGFDAAAVTGFSLTLSEIRLNETEAFEIPAEAVSGAVSGDEMQPETEEIRVPDPDEEHASEQDGTGAYLVSDNDRTAEVTVHVPDGYVYDSASDRTGLIVQSADNTSEHAISATYSVYKKSDSYSEEDIQSYQGQLLSYMLTNGDYDDPIFTETKQTSAGGYTVSYTILTYLYLGTVYITNYNTWTTLSDGRILQVKVMEESRDVPGSSLSETSLRAIYQAVEE